MTTTTIRVSTQTHQTITQLAHAENTPITTIVERAIEQYRRQRLLEQANVAYAALRAEPAALASWEAEQREWDAVLTDGLEEPY